MSNVFPIALLLLPAVAWAAHPGAHPVQQPADDPKPAAAEAEADSAERTEGEKPAAEGQVDEAAQASPAPQSETDALHAGGELDLNSRFLWRGVALSRGPALQPSLFATGYGFTATLFANVLLNDESPQNALSLVIPALTYAWVHDLLKIEPGIVYYGDTLPGQSTWEVTLDVSWRAAPFQIVGRNSFDGGKHAGAYHGSIGAEYEHELSPFVLKASVELGWATAGFNQAWFGADTSALDVLQGHLATQYDFSDSFYFALHVEASALLDSALRQHTDAVLVNGGVSLGVQF